MQFWVGVEQYKMKVMPYLRKESPEELEVISIVGMAGLGKTVLARLIFKDQEIRSMFPILIWIYVSQEFTKKEIFLEILKEFTLLTEDIQGKPDEALADLVVGYLEKERFLLVLDDVWRCEDWDKLRVALPMSNKMGKVLITTRFKEVGNYVCRRHPPCFMGFLHSEHSYFLLKWEVFGGEEIPPELEVEGRRIAEKCGGHAFAIVLIGGILVKQFSTDMNTMKRTWKEVSEKLDIFASYDTAERLPKIIEWSYEKLPHYLRECFLYFGMFPEDFEISVWKLIRLWIAEGFIQPKVGVRLEETAENYLQEFIERKLVRAEKSHLDGKVKTCRIHDMIRDFCLSEAEKEGFFQQIVMSSDGDFRLPVSEELKFRRLCIHAKVMNFLSRKPDGPRVRSFICSSRDEMDMPKKDL